MRSSPVMLLILVLALPSAALAGIADVSPALRERAEAVCRDDAIRLCVDAIPDEAAIVACMKPKRALLGTACRRVFDDVMRNVRR